MKIKLCKEDKQQFIDMSKDRRVFLEGNIIKLIDGGDDVIFKQYNFKSSIPIFLFVCIKHCVAFILNIVNLF